MHIKRIQMLQGGNGWHLKHSSSYSKYEFPELLIIYCNQAWKESRPDVIWLRRSRNHHSYLLNRCHHNSTEEEWSIWSSYCLHSHCHFHNRHNIRELRWATDNYCFHHLSDMNILHHNLLLLNHSYLILQNLITIHHMKYSL